MPFLAFPALVFAQEYLGPRIQNPPPQYCCKFPFPENPYAYATTDSCNRNGGSIVEDSLCRVKPPVAAPAAPKPVASPPVQVPDPANADLRKLIDLTASDIRANREKIKANDEKIQKASKDMQVAWATMKTKMDEQEKLLNNFWKGSLPKDLFARQIEISRRSEEAERAMRDLAQALDRMKVAKQEFLKNADFVTRSYLALNPDKKQALDDLEKELDKNIKNVESQINAMQRARFLGLWYYRPFMILPMPPLVPIR